MTVLSVNLNKIALLRNSREGDYPSVMGFAQLAVEAGAKSLTIHPRPDQRHIRVTDVYQLSEYTRSLTEIEFNIEGNPFAEPIDSSKDDLSDYPGLMTLLEQTRPNQATLVPDSQDQLTSDHGFDLKKDGKRLAPLISQLADWGIRTSLFMDPNKEQIQLAKDIGADRIELYTGPYAEAYKSAPEQIAILLKQYEDAALFANDIGLGVNAGHDLNLNNLKEFLTIPNIAEVSIGHALTVEALISGYKNTIVNYSRLCQSNNN